MGRLTFISEWRLPGEEDEIVEQEDLTPEEAADRFIGGAPAPVSFWQYDKD